MKRLFICVLCIALMSMVLCSCTEDKAESDLWKNATYTSDTELGKGDTTVEVKLTAEKKSVTFTIHTDKETLGDALLEHKLISGEKGPYGMYVKKVNGIEADYDKTKTYWGFNKNGESMMTGVDAEKISDGAKYEIVYTTEESKK